MKENLVQRKNKALFHKELVDLLTNCNTDKDYYERLTWTMEIITKCLTDFIEDDELE